MPVDLSRYPDDWPDISSRIRFGRAGNRCECDGRCGHEHTSGRCRAKAGTKIARVLASPGRWLLAGDVTRSERRRFARPVRVVLSVAHLDDIDPSNCAPSNLMAMCQHCHLLFDTGQHIISRAN